MLHRLCLCLFCGLLTASCSVITRDASGSKRAAYGEPLSLYEALNGYAGPSPAPHPDVAPHASGPVSVSALAAPPTTATPLRQESQNVPDANGVLYGLHLASYRTSGAAARGWGLVHQKAPGVLAGLHARVETVDLGDGEGAFLRLKAGPLRTRTDAEAKCSALKAAGHYCQPAPFSGDELPL